MKRLLSIVIAVIAIMVMTAVPVLADTVDTNVDVGASTTPPYMVALTMTPDDDNTAANGVDVNPEFAEPDANGNFPPTDPTADGWKLVKFYVEVGHLNGIQAIDNVAVDVFYPMSFNSVDNPLFSDRAGDLKFEINARRDGSVWTAEIVYPWSESYPANDTGGVRPPATMPALGIRELVFGLPSDMVDVNCDDTLGNDNDKTWQNFLPFWTDSRITYASGYNAGLAFEKFQLGQTMVLEIKGWMWFHQPGVTYLVKAKAATEGGATTPQLWGETSKFLDYNRVFGLFTDFDSVTYPSLTIGTDSWAEGDRFLNTPLLTTIWNNGNVGAQVLVSSTKMVKIDYANPGPFTSANISSSIYYNSAAKTIEHFDAKLYYANGAGTVLQLGAINYLADTSAEVIANAGEVPGGFGPTGPVLLQQCRPAKIEFSVHPELGESQEGGQYKGFLTVSVAAYTGGQLPTL